MNMHRRFLIFLAFFYCSLIPATGWTAAADSEKLGSAALFKKVSPGVVLLLGKDSMGSGTIVNDREILTNWHVVQDNDRIVVVFKPQEEGAPIDPDKFVVGDVVRKATDKDLALVRVRRIPSYAAPIPLGDLSELEIGADVHAIGHPQGEIWTYTRGVISQLRQKFEWRVAAGKRRFRADVIQTQTPINPGNSGGPLLSDRGRLVGVNSFKARDAEGMNFAVALSEIKRFLGDNVSRPSTSPQRPTRPVKPDASSRAEADKDPPRQATGLLFQGRDKDQTGYLRVYVPAGAKDEVRTYFYPDDQSAPAFCFRTRKGLTDAIVMDMNRDGKWNYSVLDRNRDGKLDSIGLHADGKLNPTSHVGLRDKKAPAGVREALPRRVPEQGPHNAGSPSFDCVRADTLIKQTICGSDRLADLDVTVSALYSRVTQKRPAMESQIASGQREWQRGTEAMCSEGDVAPCLENRYKQRVIYLNVLMLQ